MIQMSYSSTQRLRKVIIVYMRLRRLVELFNENIEVCEQKDEARIATIDFLDPLLSILTDLIEYLHDSASGKSLEFFPRL